MPKKSRVFPDLAALSVGSVFIVDSVARRNYAWRVAKKLGITLRSAKMPNGYFKITKVGGAAQIDAAPITEVEAGPQAARGKRSRVGLDALALDLAGVSPCGQDVFCNLPDDILRLVGSILANREPVKLKGLLSAYFALPEAEAVLKQGVLNIRDGNALTPQLKAIQAVEALSPAWENGILVIKCIPRYMSKDILTRIATEHKTSLIYAAIEVDTAG